MIRSEWPTFGYVAKLFGQYSFFGAAAGIFAFAVAAVIRHPGGVILFAGGGAATLLFRELAVTNALFFGKNQFVGSFSTEKSHSRWINRIVISAMFLMLVIKIGRHGSEDLFGLSKFIAGDIHFYKKE